MAFKTAKSVPNSSGKKRQTASVGGRQNPHIIRKPSKKMSKLGSAKGSKSFKTSATIDGGKGRQVTNYNKNKKGLKPVKSSNVKSHLRDKSSSY